MQQRCTIGGGGGFEDSERISQFDMVASGLTENAEGTHTGKMEVHVATSGVWSVADLISWIWQCGVWCVTSP